MNSFSFDDKSMLQELEPVMLDIVLAVSFDWKELANRLATSGRHIPEGQVGVLKLEQAVYRMAQSAIVNDPDFAFGVERELNRMHEKMRDEVFTLSGHKLCALLQNTAVRSRKESGGLLWALMTDDRECVRKLAGVFAQRIVMENLNAAFIQGEI